MNIRLVRVNLTGVEERLDRLNHIREQIAIANGIAVDPLPTVDETALGATHFNTEREIIESQVARKKGL